MSGSTSEPAVAEIQGIYGPFVFSEKLLQKIWAQGAYDQSQLCTTDGVKVRVINPGQWNLLAGPDFKHAQLRIGEENEKVGEVEIHLRAEDWEAHGHAGDAAYDNVVLHVVLFPLRIGHVTRNGKGEPIPTLVLLPWLHHDLEEYAAEAAVETLANQSEIRVRDILLQTPAADLLAAATMRWEQKCHFAALRIAKAGWTEACHQMAMEILGYRYNRVPMLSIAMRHRLSDWGAPFDLNLDDLIHQEASRWNVSGVRPANHPRKRLGQYQSWTRACPDWPQRLAELAAELPTTSADESTKLVRRAKNMRQWRNRLGLEISGSAIGGTRLDNMICDGFLPLVASRLGDINLFGLWYHWFLGDVPKRLITILHETETPDKSPLILSHGRVQGLLGWLIEQEQADH